MSGGRARGTAPHAGVRRLARLGVNRPRITGRGNRASAEGRARRGPTSRSSIAPCPPRGPPAHRGVAGHPDPRWTTRHSSERGGAGIPLRPLGPAHGMTGHTNTVFNPMPTSRWLCSGYRNRRDHAGVTPDNRDIKGINSAADAQRGLQGSRSANGRFQNSYLERPHFENAKMQDANLLGANLYEASLAGANLDGADLRSTPLTLAVGNGNGTYLKGAKVDAHTCRPQGVDKKKPATPGGRNGDEYGPRQNMPDMQPLHGSRRNPSPHRTLRRVVRHSIRPCRIAAQTVRNIRQPGMPRYRGTTRALPHRSETGLRSATTRRTPSRDDRI